MPVALAPSSIFPIEESLPMTTESREAFKQPAETPALSAPKPYRGPNIPRGPDQVIGDQDGIMSQIKSLTARLEALSGALPVEAPPAPAASARTAQLEGSRLPAGSNQRPWEGGTYETFASFAGEASRVRNAGRLAFGSDSKKMAV